MENYISGWKESPTPDFRLLKGILTVSNLPNALRSSGELSSVARVAGVIFQHLSASSGLQSLTPLSRYMYHIISSVSDSKTYQV